MDASVAAAHGGSKKKSWSNILVAVRCRRLLEVEARCGGRQCVDVVENKLVILEDPQTTAADDYLRIGKSKEKRYVFDHAFSEKDDTEKVYQATTRGLIEGVLRGYNATVFAYGGTGAGKTHTMIGYQNEGAGRPSHGIMGLILQDLFGQVQQHPDKKFDIRCSFLEVYNENIRDLLSPKKDECLDLREDPIKGMTVAGIEEVSNLSSAEEIMHLLKQANRNRTSEPTAANQTSSRSHAVMSVIVEQQDKTAGICKLLEVGKFSVIDLAGSERASNTANRGIRMLEGANINRSLLALGNCITALADDNSFVPYRDSKLTRLLKDSLGGNCRTVMIANVSPCHHNFEDTHNTLKYANRAKAIRTKVTRNVARYTYDVAQYTSIIHELRSEISALKTSIATQDSEAPSAAAEAGGANEQLSAEKGQAAKPQQFSEEVQTWEQEVCQNIEERVQIKRSLLDLKHSDAKCLMAKSKLQVAISSWEQQNSQNTYVGDRTIAEEPENDDDGDGDVPVSARGEGSQSLKAAESADGSLPSSIRDWRKQLKGLMKQMEKHGEIRADLAERLQKNEQQRQVLEQRLPEITLANSELRQFFSLMYKIQVMEVENMELEEVNNMTDLLIQQKDLEGEKLRLQIAIRDQMIAEQTEMVKWKGTSSSGSSGNTHHLAAPAAAAEQLQQLRNTSCPQQQDQPGAVSASTRALQTSPGSRATSSQDLLHGKCLVPAAEQQLQNFIQQDHHLPAGSSSHAGQHVSAFSSTDDELYTRERPALSGAGGGLMIHQSATAASDVLSSSASPPEQRRAMLRGGRDETPGGGAASSQQPSGRPQCGTTDHDALFVPPDSTGQHNYAATESLLIAAEHALEGGAFGQEALAWTGGETSDENREGSTVLPPGAPGSSGLAAGAVDSSLLLPEQDSTEHHQYPAEPFALQKPEGWQEHIEWSSNSKPRSASPPARSSSHRHNQSATISESSDEGVGPLARSASKQQALGGVAGAGAGSGVDDRPGLGGTGAGGDMATSHPRSHKKVLIDKVQRKRHYLPYIDAVTTKKRKNRSNMLLRAISGTDNKPVAAATAAQAPEDPGSSAGVQPGRGPRGRRV
ncbi:unnamed protein product [Amoebophrya sp. A120]|nr:unnamed protein product [Amoebophrya sp. A120]|eukprot:GSA120T00021644001.1